MTSSTKPEVHNVYYVLHCTQMRTKLPSATGSLQRQFGDVVFEIYERTDTDRHRDALTGTLIEILCTPPGEKNGCYIIQ